MVSTKGQGQFDGIPVVTYAGAFSGKFDMEEEIGEGIAFDDVVCCLVIATASKSGIDADKSGDLRRTNTFAVNNVKVLDPSFTQKLMDSLGDTDGGVTDPKFDFPPIEAEVEEELLAAEIDDDDYGYIAPKASGAIPVHDKALASFLGV